MSISVAKAGVRNGAMPALVVLCAGLLVLGGLFWREVQAAVAVWIGSTAYGHCFLIIPISAFLAWDRRDTLRGLLPRPSPRLALLALPLPAAWFVAERLGIMEGRQLVALAFAEVLMLSLLGWRLFHALLAPLLYLVFLVPFGAFLTPALQSFTARFIDVGLTILDIPHYASDMLIEIPQGMFYVAEACAGLRFLIATVAFGVFFAVLNYRSLGKRTAFIVASLLVPIVANGFRALGIVVLGTILGSAQAAATDHIIYGRVFFSLVTLLLVLAGLPFRDAPSAAVPIQPQPAGGSPALSALPVLLFAALAPAAALALGFRIEPARLSAAPALLAPAGCSIVAEPMTSDRAMFRMLCGPRTWAITVQAVPGGATANVLNQVRRRLGGFGENDEAVTAPLAGAPGWLVTTQNDPGQVTGLASWVAGAPARGGLRERLMQAQASVFGNGVPSLVMAVNLQTTGLLGTAQLEAASLELVRFVSAQPSLNAEVADLTAASALPRAR